MEIKVKFAVIGSDNPGGMPGPDDGKPGMAVHLPGKYAKGYKNLKGEWNPNGIGLVVFATEAAAKSWYDSAEGDLWAEKYNGVILAQLKA